MPRAQRHAAWLALPALLGMALTARSCHDGLCLDDHAMLSTVQGRGILPGSAPFDLFTFASGTPSSRQAMLDTGVLPWYAAADLKVSFWRPLASLSHTLDFSLFPGHPAWMHAQNVLWYGLLVAAAGLLYRKMLGPTLTALLATTLFAVHDLHGISVGWISGRNSLMGATFAALCLLAHDRWVRDGWTPGKLLGPLLFALGLLSSEGSVTILAYLAAHAAWMAPGPRWRRAAAMLPYGVTAGTWTAIYLLLGKGAAGGAAYLDPFHEPAAFLSMFPDRLLTDAAAQLSGFALPPALALPLVGLFALYAIPLVAVHRAAAVFLAGFALSMIAVAGLAPDTRLLLHTSLGLFPIVALSVTGAFGSGFPRPRQRAWRVLAGVLASFWLFSLALVSALHMPARTSSIASVQRSFDRFPLLPLPRSASDRTAIVINAADPLLAATRAVTSSPGVDSPAVLSLSFVAGPVSVTRIGDRALRIHALQGHLFAPSAALFCRAWPTPAHAARLRDLTVQVVDGPAAVGPTTVDYRFDRALDDPSLLWLAWNGTAYGPFSVPALGQTAVVPAQPL